MYQEAQLEAPLFDTAVMTDSHQRLIVQPPYTRQLAHCVSTCHRHRHTYTQPISVQVFMAHNTVMTLMGVYECMLHYAPLE